MKHKTINGRQVLASHGFHDGQKVIIPSVREDDEGNETCAIAMLHYEKELGAWILIYFDENDKPIRDEEGVNKTDFVHEIGWDGIQSYDEYFGEN